MAVTDHRFHHPTAEETITNLRRLLGFGPEDVERNRRGELSPRQRSNIVQHDIAVPIFWSMLTIIGGWAVFVVKRIVEGRLVFEALTGFFGPPDFLHAPESGVERMGGPYAIYISLLPNVIALLGLYKLPWKLFLDLLMPKVIGIEGKLDVEMRGVNDHASGADQEREWRRETGGDLLGRGESFEDWNDAQSDYSLRISGMKFPASKQVILTIDEGDWYRAYYTRFHHRLVSLEPFRKHQA